MASERVAIVTGGTRGIGFETAKGLVAQAFHVVVTGRSEASAEEAAGRLRALAQGAKVDGAALDLADFSSVRRFAEAFLARGLPLTVLVNNAGTMTQATERALAGDMEATLAANAVGPLLLTRLLEGKLVASAPSRVVNVSSRAHLPGSGYGAEVEWDWEDVEGARRWEPMRFYKNSKLAVMWWTGELARRLEGTGVVVHAVCPGFVPATVAEHAHGVRRFLMKHVLPHLPGARSVEQAAGNTLFAATSAPAGERTGRFYGEEKEVAASAQANDVAQAKRFWAWASERAGLPS